jgi:hypothetical protein
MRKVKQNESSNIVTVLLIPVTLALLAVAFTSGLYFAQQNVQNVAVVEQPAQEVVEEIKTVFINDARFSVEIPAGWSVEKGVSGDLVGWTFGNRQGMIEMIHAEEIEKLVAEEMLMVPNREVQYQLGGFEVVARVYHGNDVTAEFLQQIENILNSVSRQP